jgi:hypothetical protein
MRGVLRLLLAGAAVLGVANSAEAATLKVTTSPDPRVLRELKVSVTGQGAPQSELYVVIDRKGCEATATAEQRAYNPRGGGWGEAPPQDDNARIVELVSGRDPTSGPFDTWAGYTPLRFDVTEHICAYLTEPVCDAEGACEVPPNRPPAAFEDRPLKPGLLIPRGDQWSGGVATAGIVSITTYPRSRLIPGRTVRTSPGHILITGDCARKGGQHGRRWYLPNLAVSSHGTFAYNGKVIPDNTSNYDSPIPAPWPTQHIRVRLRGGFVGHRLPVIRGKITVSGAHCGTHTFRAHEDGHF